MSLNFFDLRTSRSPLCYHFDYILKQGGDDNPQCHSDQPPHPTYGKSAWPYFPIDYLVYHLEYY